MYFMSDYVEQYFNAWSRVFGNATRQKLFGIWHVDRAWREGLHEHVSNQQEEAEVYHQLRVLLQYQSVSEFTVGLQQYFCHTKMTSMKNSTNISMQCTSHKFSSGQLVTESAHL